jgi:hypothetical protein
MVKAASKHAVLAASAFFGMNHQYLCHALKKAISYP